VAFALQPVSALANGGDPYETVEQAGTHTQVTTKPGGFEAAGAVSEKVPGRDKATPGGQAARLSAWTTVAEKMAPTCSGNSRQGGDTLCGAAVYTCPPAQVRFWIWHQEVRWARAADGTVTHIDGPWVQEPGSYCLGPDDPGVPDYAKAIALVQAGFQNLPLPRAKVQVAPAPQTLVHVPTAFYAGGAQTFTQTVTPVPGIRVTVTAKPTSWTWTWGDGTTGTFDTPGEPSKPVVSHTYGRTGTLTARVAVSWEGSFTLAGSDQVLDIPTPAVVSSDPVPVQVGQARTQLVAP
jgi:hypothetical protein